MITPLTLGLVSLILLTVCVRAAWYWASSTTYTTFTFTRPLTSGLTRRDSGSVEVKRPELSAQGDRGGAARWAPALVGRTPEGAWEMREAAPACRPPKRWLPVRDS